MGDSSQSGTALVIFMPSGKRGHFPTGTPILKAARSLGVDLDSVCGGRGLCGRCQIDVGVGDFAKHGITSATDHLSAMGEAENHYGHTKGIKQGRRLGCQAMILGDVVIDVPPESQVHRQVVRKRAEARDIVIDPDIHLYYVEDAEGGDPVQMLAQQWQLGALETDPAVDIQGIGNAFTAAVRGGGRIVAVWPGYHEAIYGIAFDIGSTTIAGHLCNLASGEVVAAGGLMNPQIRFGEDLMSRVSYAMMNEGGAGEMTTAVRAALNELVADVVKTAGIDLTDILSATIVGNPVMHHLVLGLDPIPLGQSPFPLAVETSLNIAASEIDLVLNPGASIYVLPCIAGHVGADAAAVILSEAPHKADEITLAVDVGTNAEIVLGNRDRLLACSSPTGPAFEGAQITCGQRAAPGAIERVRIDRATLEPRFRVIGSDKWSDEDGFEDAIKSFGITGICGSGIIEVIAEMFLCGIITADGVVDGDKASASQRIVADGRTFSYVLHDGEQRIVVTQTDVRAIQLAKGALYAGARLLMDNLGVETVDRIRLAGAFGNQIDVKYAMVLGLIPDCPLEQVQSAGNAAGTGARIALLNMAARAEIETVVAEVEKIETATEPAFQRHFVDAMAFPHKTADYPNLSKVVDLPPRSAPAGAGKRRRGRK
mgnify:CR=1 FL=1